MKSVKRSGLHYVYILECKDGSYYTGYTRNLDNRIREHNNSKRKAKCLRGKLPVKLAWCRKYSYYKRAVQAESRIKKLNHEQKAEIVRNV